MTHAHCRTCGAKGSREEATQKKDLGVDNGGLFDACQACGSLDVDILSDAGLRHEEEKAIS